MQVDRNIITVFFFIGIVVFIPLKQNSIAADSIVLGQSCALSGPAKNLGLEMRAGLLAAFSKVNDEGGVGGRDRFFLRTIARSSRQRPRTALAFLRYAVPHTIIV